VPITSDPVESPILVVDDEPANCLVLDMLLRQGGYKNVYTCRDPREFDTLMARHSPDLVLLDLHMPFRDGFEILQSMHIIENPLEAPPVIVLTADVTMEARRRALSLGARDFLTKPFEHYEVTLRVRNMLQLRLLHRRLHQQNEDLERRVDERTRELTRRNDELAATRLEILKRLARASEYRDDDTGQHTSRVGRICARIAATLGMDPEWCADMKEAAPLHDVGKIGIPDSILLKPGKLDPHEWEVMKTHTDIGARILSGSRHPVLQLAEEIARTHHERYDGTGYMGWVGEDIPISGRIVAIADVFDALLHDRPYKKAWPREKALHEIISQRGRHFDPSVVDAFLRVIQEPCSSDTPNTDSDVKRGG
jgi:putative two-component system response regulator